MSDSSKYRDANKAKAHRLVKGDPREKTDSSTWTPPEAEEAGVKTGARPLVKRLYKKGGKVVGKHEGEKSEPRSDRKPRKSGGKAMNLDDLMNRDMRMANEKREGHKHEGAFNDGGRAKKFGGGPIGANPVSNQAQAMQHPFKKGGKVEHTDEAEDKKLIRREVKAEALKRKHGGEVAHHPNCRCEKCSGGNVFSGDSKKKIPGDDGGRQARKEGGRTKGKTQVNIIISGHGEHPALGNGTMPNAPVAAPMPPKPVMPPQGMPPMPPGGPMGGPPMPPQGMPPMARKAGGRTSYPIDTGSGGAEARLEKIKAYGPKK